MMIMIIMIIMMMIIIVIIIIVTIINPVIFITLDRVFRNAFKTAAGGFSRLT